MSRKPVSFPVNKFGDDLDTGMSIERVILDKLPPLGEWDQPERHDRHSFFLVESGSVTMEIDFREFVITAPSLIYMHPDQVHRIIAFDKIVVIAWAIIDERLNPDYLHFMNELTSAGPLPLSAENFGLLGEAAGLCLKIAARGSSPLSHSLLTDNGNALTGLAISYFLQSVVPVNPQSRAEVICKAFREALSMDYNACKRPADYADKLSLSTAYLNECVKVITGHPVSYHIQERIVLEAKRMLYHSDSSLKEIAAALGYDDYPYFSRLFSKVTSMSPLAFRSKNLV